MDGESSGDMDPFAKDVGFVRIIPVVLEGDGHFRYTRIEFIIIISQPKMESLIPLSLPNERLQAAASTGQIRLATKGDSNCREDCTLTTCIREFSVCSTRQAELARTPITSCVEQKIDRSEARTHIEARLTVPTMKLNLSPNLKERCL